MSGTHLNISDIDAMPAWDFTVRVRGIELPMVSPMEIGDINASPIPEQARIDAMMKRWPGVFVWAWRALFGAPRLDREDIPSDGGAAHVRMVCGKILGESHRELIDELRTCECSLIVACYMSCQGEWMHRAGQVFRERASEHLRRSSPTSTERAAVASTRATTPIMHGDQLKIVDEYATNIIRGGVQA